MQLNLSRHHQNPNKPLSFLIVHSQWRYGFANNRPYCCNTIICAHCDARSGGRNQKVAYFYPIRRR